MCDCMCHRPYSPWYSTMPPECHCDCYSTWRSKLTGSSYAMPIDYQKQLDAHAEMIKSLRDRIEVLEKQNG